MDRPIEYKHPNRRYSYLYLVLLLTPVMGFFLYDKAEWWMFFACLLMYIIQMIPFMYLCLESAMNMKTETIDASELKKYVERERRFQTFHSVILAIAAILDLFPFYAMIPSFMGNRVYEGGVLVSLMSLFMAGSLFFLGSVAPWSSHNGSLMTNIFNIAEDYERTGLTTSERKAKNEERIKRIEEEQRNAEIQRYGEGFIVIDRQSKIILNENTQKLFIHDIGYDFKDILSFSVYDDSEIIQYGGTSTIKTDLGSTIGRAAIGGALFGDVGAIIGGVTATKTIENDDIYSSVEHDYELMITIDDLTSPMVTVELGPDQELLGKLSSVLTVIISRNNKVGSVSQT